MSIFGSDPVCFNLIMCLKTRNVENQNCANKTKIFSSTFFNRFGGSNFTTLYILLHGSKSFVLNDVIAKISHQMETMFESS